MQGDSSSAGTTRVGARRRAERAPGWGFGIGVQLRRTSLGPSVGSYGWAGGLGSSWGNDPIEDVVAVILTTDMFTSAFPPPAAIRDLWTGLYAALR